MVEQRRHQNKRDFLIIRFSGQDLDIRGVPIYELSQAFMAIQRIIHKAYRFNKWGPDGLERKVTLPTYIREDIALQISEHRKGSDIYGFIPFAPSNQTNQLLADLVGNAITALGFYAYQARGISGHPNENKTVTKGTFLREGSDSNKRKTFKDLMMKHFDMADLRELCFDLDIDYEDLGGEKKIEKVLSLIEFMQKHARTSFLIQICRERRPFVDWPIYDNASSHHAIAHDEKENRENLRVLAGSIYREIRELNARIENIGGIDTIEFSSPIISNDLSFLFNNDTKHFAEQLDKEPYLGETQTIEGHIITLYLTTKSVDLMDTSGNKIKIFLNSNDFENVRQHKKQHPRVRIQGRPIYRLGTEGLHFTEMDVEDISFLGENDK